MFRSQCRNYIFQSFTMAELTEKELLECQVSSFRAQRDMTRMKTSEAISRLVHEIWTWWRYLMETFSESLAIGAGNSPVTGEFPAQRPVTQGFDIFFDLRLNIQLNKQSHYNDVIMSAMTSQITISEKISKLRVTGLFERNSPVTGEFSAQKGQWRGKCFHLMASSWWGWWVETPWSSLWRHCNVSDTHECFVAVKKMFGC